jgi:hypothetical protein
VAYAAFTLCWCQGLYQWGVGRKLQAPTIVWKKRRIDPFLGIYWVCVFFPALTSKPNLYCNETWKYLGGVEQCLMSHAKVCITVPLDCCILGVQGLLIQIRVWHFTKHRYCIKKHRLLQSSKASTRLSYRGHEALFSSDMAWNQLLCPGQRRDSLLWGHLGRVKTWSIRTISRRMMSLHRQCWFLKSRGLRFTIPSQFIPVYEMGYHVDHEMW